MYNKEFEDDIVFTRFINYMQIALLHEKINYEKHKKFINRKEEKLNYIEWTRIPDKTDANNPFYALKRDYDDLKIQIAEFDCKVDYFVFNIDENNNRSKEIKISIKVKVFSDIDTNIKLET